MRFGPLEIPKPKIWIGDALIIHPDGRLEAGDIDAASRGLFDAMALAFPRLIDQWAAARGWTPPAAERVARFYTDGMPD